MSKEWSRGPQWTVGGQARERLAPLFKAAAAAWRDLELTSVSHGLRTSARLDLTPDDYVVAFREVRRRGLSLTPLSAASGQVRAALHVPGLGDAWLAAARDDEATGQLLGYPACALEPTYAH